MLASCFKKKELLLENDYEINNLNNLIRQYKSIIGDYESEINELRCKLNIITPSDIVKDILSCKRSYCCQHENCDFGPIIVRCQEYEDKYNAFMSERDENYELNNRIQMDSNTMNNMNNKIFWYKENYQKLLDKNEFNTGLSVIWEDRVF